ncbi:ORF V: Enzymatic polyprotein [Labeo rohita]|uniref:ORF V: Enzymatic polyprotein n=1 Tax=Labeo rohita TaxID=84645 RepID=A0ABQ8L9P7_LABRO|nr:ORF V: Enzymatic polyprotein [Labeo rohita]
MSERRGGVPNAASLREKWQHSPLSSLDLRHRQRCVATLRCGSTVPLKQVQRLLGHMASSAAVTPLGLMHMRPLQHWLHTRVPRWAWHQGTFRVNVTPSCRKTLSPWTDIVFLRSGVPLEQVSRRIVVTTDASKTGWGAICNGQAAFGVWTGPRLLWHINCLELLAVLLALRRFRPLIQGKHVLVRSDNTATVAYINHQGGVRSFRMSQLDLGLYVPLTFRDSLGGEWRLHPHSVQLIWDRFGQAQVDLFASSESTHCQLCEPHCTDSVQSQGRQGTDSLGSPLLAQQNLVPRPGAPGISSSLAHSSEEGPPLSGEGHNLAPAPRSLEPPPMVPGLDQEDFRDLPPSVVNTLLQARAPSTRRLYDLKWRIFVNWYSSWGKDPWRCGIKSVLSFLQESLDRHLSASTLKVHVAAISANHDLVSGRLVGKHDLIIRFLRGARRLNPPRSNLIPSWDLAVILQGLQQDLFEPLQSVELDALSLKTALLTVLTLVKRVGDLQALSVNSSCLEFGPANSHVVLRPRPGYVPKVPTTPFRDQVVTLQAISSQEDDPNLTLLCPVHALCIYLERTQPFRRSEQLFVCYGEQQKGKAVSNQRISHWLVDAIRMAYQARGLPCPLGVRAHSTRGVAALAALANGASLTDICRAAGCDLRSAFFLRETDTLPTFSRHSAAPLRKGPAAGLCYNRFSLMEGTETLCRPCHNSGPPLSELRRSAPQIRTSEQMRMLPYLYPDVRGVASYANSAHPISLAFFKTVRGVWAPKSDP